MHKPIEFKNLTLSFPHKTCFIDFNAQVVYGSRIVIIGRNGSGKTTLLKIIQKFMEPTSGEIKIPSDVISAYVPQTIEDFDDHSGGERFHKALTQALALQPNVLLLDEPTNHLDHDQRRQIMRMLQNYSGTLFIVSHDQELLRHCVDTLWHIDQEKIHVFIGKYDDYIREIKTQQVSIERELTTLKRKKKEMHHRLMQEQERAAKSRAKGEKGIAQRKWPTIVSKSKALNAQETSGHKKAALDHQKQELREKLSYLREPEEIIPTFSLTAADLRDRILISISDVSIGYVEKKPIAKNIYLSLSSKGRMAIQGKNGCGKTTLIKAILNDPIVVKTGHWQMPNLSEIGYLDQHYATLNPIKTVFEVIAEWVPGWPLIQVRRHLCDFLFKKNEEVNLKVNQLSGGEKARLSLAQIAAKTPKLLILDEMTNNLDLETRQYVIDVLKAYPGALLVVSHDAEFLEEIRISEQYHL